jgi:hypothetical protein
MIFDRDGSFSGTGQPTYITPYYNHFDKAINDALCNHE